MLTLPQILVIQIFIHLVHKFHKIFFRSHVFIHDVRHVIVLVLGVAVYVVVENAFFVLQLVDRLFTLHRDWMLDRRRHFQFIARFLKLVDVGHVGKDGGGKVTFAQNQSLVSVVGEPEDVSRIDVVEVENRGNVLVERRIVDLHVQHLLDVDSHLVGGFVVKKAQVRHIADGPEPALVAVPEFQRWK